MGQGNPLVCQPSGPDVAPRQIIFRPKCPASRRIQGRSDAERREVRPADLARSRHPRRHIQSGAK